MNQKNHDAKRSARERLHAQRAKDQARARRSRQAIVAGSVVAALAIAGGIGIWASMSGGGGNSTDNESARPRQASGGDKPAIPVGALDAPSTLTVWEDFRCPACRQFETGFRPVLHELEDSGHLKTEYHLVTIIDGNTGGKGSRRAANAALCAQDAGRFREYHDVLYAHQPPEQQDKFADNQHLLQLAEKVKGLPSAAFTKCVNDGRYDGFVEKSDTAFAGSGFQGTPTVLLNGKDLSKEKGGRFTAADLKKTVLAANKGKQPGKPQTPPQPSQTPRTSQTPKTSRPASQPATGTSQQPQPGASPS
ncbi:DsbA family protein [Streptomyces chattanoogensis]|uniref:DsbA family protein n=1 Tax=Streptomyces chattanoogensis TaxID=66876 RepID=UPI003685B07E